MKEITVQELADALKQNVSFTLLDVREPYEYEVCHIDDCMHIPMGEIPSRIQEIDNSKEVYVMCQSGVRASAVANFLKTNYGFSKIAIVIGGVNAYIEEIDQSINI